MLHMNSSSISWRMKEGIKREVKDFPKAGIDRDKFRAESKNRVKWIKAEISDLRENKQLGVDISFVFFDFKLNKYQILTDLYFLK